MVCGVIIEDTKEDLGPCFGVKNVWQLWQIAVPYVRKGESRGASFVV